MNNNQTIVAAAALLNDMRKQVQNDLLATITAPDNSIQFKGVFVTVSAVMPSTKMSTETERVGRYIIELTVNGDKIRLEDSCPVTELTKERVAGQIAGAMLEKLKYEFIRLVSPEFNKIGML